jgi:hypothetical protein
LIVQMLTTLDVEASSWAGAQQGSSTCTLQQCGLLQVHATSPPAVMVTPGHQQYKNALPVASSGNSAVPVESAAYLQQSLTQALFAAVAAGDTAAVAHALKAGAPADATSGGFAQQDSCYALHNQVAAGGA